MTLATALRLGRVSNLPTVWTNALAGTALAGGQIWTQTTLLVVISLSLLYVSGMYLNDAFDRDIDAVERPDRPIPAGAVSVNTVFGVGFGLMLGGLAFMLWGSATVSETSVRPMTAALTLAGAILFYDWHHKGNAFSPLVMGLCRFLAYLTAGYAAAMAPSPMLFLAAFVSLCYLIGLTYAAKQEALDRLDNLWPLLFLGAPIFYGLAIVLQSGVLAAVALAILVIWTLVALYFLRRRAKGDVPRAVVSLIAGISLVDALFLSAAGAVGAAMVAGLCFLLTLTLQRWVSGT
jgi:4-hydroxybenzoate polyprenyltransferase